MLFKNVRKTGFLKREATEHIQAGYLLRISKSC